MTSSIVPYDDPQIFTFRGKGIRTGYGSNGDPVFVAADICAALGIVNVGNAVSRLDADEKDDIRLPDVIGRMQQILVVTESGLYTLILRSDKPDAKEFRRWVTHDVLPALRKTGSYAATSVTPAEAFLQIAQQMVKTERAVAELNQTVGNLILDNESIHAELLDKDYHTIEVWCHNQRIRFTSALVQKWGREATALSRERSIEKKYVAGGAYPVGRYHKLILLDVCIPKPKTNGQLPLLKDNDL